jgi:hypothetical protein
VTGKEAAERALRDTPELELVTRGRVSGREHSVRLHFVYADGTIWVRTDERPPAPDASGVHRRTGRERDPDWLRNLEADPSATVRVADGLFAVRYAGSTDETADLRRVVDLMRAKYGADWVEDWYVDRGRVAVKLRLG